MVRFMQPLRKPCMMVSFVEFKYYSRKDTFDDHLTNATTLFKAMKVSVSPSTKRNSLCNCTRPFRPQLSKDYLILVDLSQLQLRLFVVKSVVNLPQAVTCAVLQYGGLLWEVTRSDQLVFEFLFVLFFC